MSDYTEDDIFTPERLDVVRLRPTAYFHSTDIEGLLHQALEIITNAIDEIALMADLVGRVLVLLCIDAERETYQIVVKDTGRGLPVGKLLDSYTKLNTSAKFDTKAYEHSGGLYGVGAKASAGTSRHFRSITHRPKASASIYVHEGKSDEKVELIERSQEEGPNQNTGVTVIFEPDPIIFQTDISLFGKEGIDKLLTIIQKYCFFRRLAVSFRVCQTGLPKKIWKTPIPEAEKIVDKFTMSSQIVFDEQSFDRTQWIRNYFGITRPITLQHTITNTFVAPHPKDSKRTVNGRYEVRIYVVKFDTVGGRFGMVNNNGIDDAKSTHFVTVMDVLKIALGHHIKDVAMRKFFLESYRIPLFLAVDIKYPGAEPSGTTKHAFISRAFRSVYEPSLQQQLSTPDGVAFITTLYQEMAEDIETRYTIATTGTPKIKDYNRLFERFNNLSDRFKDCSTQDRLTAELFLVEGRSAGGGAQGRDSRTQAVYMLSGKPFNGIISEEEMRQSAIAIKDHRIYSELLAITGINPAKFDKTSLNFGKVLIWTDADDHGQHISAILVGNFYTLCPDIVHSGILHVVVPPLFSLEHKGKKKAPKLYFRDGDALNQWLIENVYTKSLDIGVRFRGETKTNFLEPPSCQNFLKLIVAIGEAINNVSSELVLDPFIVERLTHVTGYLEEGKIDVDRIQQVLKDLDHIVDRVRYDPNGHILFITVGRDDHIIPLQNVRQRLVDLVLPLMNRMRWRTTRIYITTRHTAEFKDTPVSVMKLYTIMEAFRGMFNIKRYKGIGSMPPDDKGRTCMNPETRNVFQITSVGDVSRIFELLGNDAIHRKKLIRST